MTLPRSVRQAVNKRAHQSALEFEELEVQRLTADAEILLEAGKAEAEIVAALVGAHALARVGSE